MKFYTLSQSSTSMINAMHRKLLFLDKLPASYIPRSKMKKDAINYDGLLEEFNQKVREKAAQNSV